MGLLYEKLMRPVIFKQDPEKAHEMVVSALKLLIALGPIRNVLELVSKQAVGGTKPIELFGLQFPSAVGLAAGFDKNAEIWRAAAALGFGHIETGTITRFEQPGNPKPRLFRFPAQEGIVNQMGFNNIGAEKVAANLKKNCKPQYKTVPLGINIGKSKVTPLDQAIEDYSESFSMLSPYADYITINLSSPNTPELRKLQSEKYLEELLSELKSVNLKKSKNLGTKPIPMLLKIAPDLSFPEIDKILETIQNLDLSGIIATNTTISRPGPLCNIKEEGGLSGAPLHPKSIEIVKYISKRTEAKLPIIGVGGIHSVADAGAMMDAGASLVQIYSAMIFRGPFFARELAKALSARHSKLWI